VHAGFGDDLERLDARRLRASALQCTERDDCGRNYPKPRPLPTPTNTSIKIHGQYSFGPKDSPEHFPATGSGLSEENALTLYVAPILVAKPGAHFRGGCARS
jgi:hypothetical protein